MAKKTNKTAITSTASRPKAGAVPASAKAGLSKLWIVALLVVTAIVYNGALQNGITFMDDDSYLLKNPFLFNFSLDGVKDIFTSFYEFNYHPLTTLTFLVEHRLFGFDPKPYHAFNVILHLVNTWLVYRLTAKLSGKDVVGLIVAALFALHPMHVESVAWISERKGLLCGLFYLSALLMYLRYVDGGAKKKFYFLSLLLFVLACFSKSAAVTLPVLLLAVDWYRGRKISSSGILEKVPFFAVAIVFGVLAILSQKEGGALTELTANYGVVNRVFLFTTGLAFYFVKLVMPVHLSGLHYFPNMTAGGGLPWYYYGSLPLLVAIGWLAVRRSSSRKEVLFGMLFFLIAISVMLQVITVGLAVASERYTYISYIGLFYIVAQLLVRVGEERKTLANVALVAVLLIFSGQSWARVAAWKDTDTLFSDIIARNEGNANNYLVYYHWGESKKWYGYNKEAIALYGKAAAIAPRYARTWLGRGESHYKLGELPAAIKDYQKAIELNPRSAQSYNNLGWAYFETNEREKAMQYFNKALEIDAKDAQAYNNRGWARMQLGDSTRALQDFDKAILNAPRFEKPYYNRALIKLYREDRQGAINDYTTLISINASDAQAYLYRGICYMELKNNVMAEEDLQKAISLGSRDAVAILRNMKGGTY